jgi:hypothetical protein
MSGLRFSVFVSGRGSLLRRMSAVVASSVLVLGAVAVVQIAVASSPAAAATPGTALINGDTVSGGSSSLEAQAAEAAGLTVTVVTGADWEAMTAEQFGTYQVLIAGDPACGTVADSFTSNASTWAPVVMGDAGGRTRAGNRVVIGTDPVFHYTYGGSAGAVTLINDGVAFAGSQPGRTGLYFDASCGGANILSTLSSLSSGTGTWTENDSPPCGGNVAKIASTPTFDSLKSSDLEGWGCSVHESFPTFPSDWHALAIATDTQTTPTCGTDVDTGATACGQAYVLVAGSDIVVTSPDLTLLPATGTDPVGGKHTVTATVTRSGVPVAGTVVSFTVTGVNDGASGTCSANANCTTDSNGQVSFTYTGSNGLGDDTISASFTDAESGGFESATASEEWTAKPITVAPASTTTRLAINRHKVRTGGMVTLSVKVRSTAGMPAGIVTFRGAHRHRIVGQATLVGGFAKVRIRAGHRALVRHFVATYTGNSAYAPSRSNRVWLLVMRRATPALLPNTGARWASERIASTR